MSVVLNGESQQIETLVRFLHNYKALCANEQINQIVDQNTLTLVNKYYSAQLTLYSVEFGVDSDASLFDDAEGYILVANTSDSDLSLPKYSLSSAAIEADTGLRLLVAMTAGVDAAHRKVYEEWALENGFEYIEIDTANPTKDHQEREKYGLPRLLEALESNMWSTMQRAPRSTPAASSSSSSAAAAGGSASASTAEVAQTLAGVSLEAPSTYTPPTLPTPTSASSLPTPPASTTTASTNNSSASTRVDSTPAPTPAASAEPRVDPFELEMEDKEDNEIVDKYADFISEVKNFREQATAGQITDQARRDQAAEMALRLAQLMGMDDESDSDSSV